MMSGDPKTFLIAQLGSQSSEAGTKVLATSERLKAVAEQLKGDDLTRPVAPIAARGAQSLERVGRYLCDADGMQLLADADRFGRERPWVLASAGIALGLASSRALKLSTARRTRPDASPPEATPDTMSEVDGARYNGA